jgi:hypothetical protein
MRLLILGILCCLHSCALLAQAATTGCKIELYMLKKNHIPQADIDEPIGYFMPSKADLADYPLVADNEIMEYDIQKDTTRPYAFNITKKAALRVDSIAQKVPLYGLAFAMVVNGEPVFGGYFWSPSSSYVCTWLTAFAAADRISIYPCYSGMGYTDPRLNTTLMDCLKKTSRAKFY